MTQYEFNDYGFASTRIRKPCSATIRRSHTVAITRLWRLRSFPMGHTEPDGNGGSLMAKEQAE